jgi:hypothetical protein
MTFKITKSIFPKGGKITKERLSQYKQKWYFSINFSKFSEIFELVIPGKLLDLVMTISVVNGDNLKKIVTFSFEDYWIGPACF